MEITLPIPEKVSLNKIYAGIHFSQRSYHKDAYYLAGLSVRPPKYEGTYPCAAHYHFKLHGKQLDISNHAYMVKMTEDALVALGVIPEDGPKFIGKIIITAEKSDLDEVVITLCDM